MICRRVVKDNGIHNVVWFNSYGTITVYNPEKFTSYSSAITFAQARDCWQNFHLSYESSSSSTAEFLDESDNVIYTKTFSAGAVDIIDTVKGSASEKVAKFALTGSDITNFELELEEVIKAKKDKNYSEEKEAVRDSLIQNLSVIETELWWNMRFGLPLFSNIVEKVELDIAITEIVMNTPNVVQILELESTKIAHRYNAYLKVQTTFGELSVNI